MSRFFFACVLLLGTLSGAVPAQNQRSGDATSERTRFDENSVELLAGIKRSGWQKPRLVMRLLANMRGETVGEVGAGMGYFTHLLSGAVGAEGKIYVVEFDPDLLAGLQEFVADFRSDNGVVLRGTEADPGLPAGELDMVFSVNTWHHLADRAAMREAVQRALKPGGRFVVIDWRDGEIPIAPPQDHRLERSELIREMKADGWTVTTDGRFLEYQYFLIFAPPEG